MYAVHSLLSELWLLISARYFAGSANYSQTGDPMRPDAFRTKQISLLSILLCGVLLAPSAIAQSDTGHAQRLSDKEFKEALKRFQEYNKRDAEKARKGECTPGKTHAGNPTDRYCQIVYDADFVIRAIDTPDPTPDVWQRLDELSLLFPKKTDALILEHLHSQPTPTEADINAFVEKTRADMATMKGGTFTMGDYGWLEEPAWPITRSKADDNPFPVTLSEFLIQKRRITIAEYDTYTRNHGLPLIGTALISSTGVINGETVHSEYYDVKRRYPGYNARVTWQQAHDYCAWLADVSGQPFALPTEAQWEYSARSGGKPYAFGIANPHANKVDPIKFENDLKAIAGEHRGPDYLFNRPSGVFGPNPAGLYDFIGYGKEWVNDWYARYPDPAAERPLHNPTGPVSGTEKVARASAAGSGTVLNRYGWGEDYEVYDDDDPDTPERASLGGPATAAFRCVINAPRWK